MSRNSATRSGRRTRPCIPCCQRSHARVKGAVMIAIPARQARQNNLYTRYVYIYTYIYAYTWTLGSFPKAPVRTAARPVKTTPPPPPLGASVHTPTPTWPHRADDTWAKKKRQAAKKANHLSAPVGPHNTHTRAHTLGTVMRAPHPTSEHVLPHRDTKQTTEGGPLMTRKP
jgi:hypothetical protein